MKQIKSVNNLHCNKVKDYLIINQSNNMTIKTKY